MRKSRFTESQIVAILKEGEAGVALSELTRKYGISRATYFNWQAKDGGVSVSELKRMKGLEAENAKNWAVGSWGGRRPSPGGYVAGTGATDGGTPAGGR